MKNPLSRTKPDVHKNDFGHVLILAGSGRMLGAAALSGLAAMRSGAGLVTIGIPKSLNTAAQIKVANVIMTLPLPETGDQSLSFSALGEIESILNKYDAIALGPGMGRNKDTRRLILALIKRVSLPLVIDADALRAVAENLVVLTAQKNIKVLTPHPGEMAHLTESDKGAIEDDRKGFALDFAKRYRCVLLLKGHRTVVASPDGKTYVNKTGNAGMATAGSGDVLTGMITAFLAQGMSGFEAAKYGAYFHGIAGDRAAKKRSRAGMIATDIIEEILKSHKTQVTSHKFKN
jgi:ADP-dependent NAD(P)H-hydrate dehydratase / NAD(P)H-hydrate epimerase